MNQKNTINITFFGDIFPGELPFTLKYGIRSQFNRHKGKPWISKIKGILGDNDIIIGNLESPLVTEDDSLKKTFFGDPDFANFLKECGINVLNVANNHTLEQGNQGFSGTIGVLNKADLGVIGNNENSRSKILYKNVNNMKIAMAGFSQVDLHKIKNDDYFAVLDEDNVIKSLQEMEANNADVKILSFHWGDEYMYVPTLQQRKMAYKFVDNGADIIVGHHPHVIQPYEQYKNGHIFYSLGNFVFDFIHAKNVSMGMVASIEIKEGKQFNVDLKGVKLSYKNTVTLLSEAKFKKYYSRITKLYDRCKTMTDKDYQNSYRTTLKRNLLLQRIVMKTSLMNEFFRIKNNDKKFLLRNIFNYWGSILKTGHK